MSSIFILARSKPIYSRLLLYGVGAAIGAILWWVYQRAIQEQPPIWHNDGFSNWARDLDAGPAVATADQSVIVTGFAYINGELYAVGIYKNTSEHHGRYVPGVLGKDGRFWLKVGLLVGNDLSEWSTVANEPRKTGEITRKVLGPGETLLGYIDLELFKPLVRKYRYGRIVTDTGQTANFELKELTAPPAES